MQSKNVISPSLTGDVDHSTTEIGNVVLRGVTVPLNSDVAAVFVADCARNLERLLSDLEIRTKYELTSEEWEGLAENTSLLRKVRAERDRRLRSGEAAREAAQRHFAEAPHVLHSILVDDQVSPRHRIEAARELRQSAGDTSDASQSEKKFKIVINLGADEKLMKEFTPNFPEPPPSDDGAV